MLMDEVVDDKRTRSRIRRMRAEREKKETPVSRKSLPRTSFSPKNPKSPQHFEEAPAEILKHGTAYTTRICQCARFPASTSRTQAKRSTEEYLIHAKNAKIFKNYSLELVSTQRSVVRS
jgi:hypothetical protein